MRKTKTTQGTSAYACIKGDVVVFLIPSGVIDKNKSALAFARADFYPYIIMN